MCKFSKKAAQRQAKRGKAFNITRNIEDLHELAEELKVYIDENGEKVQVDEVDAAQAERMAVAIDKTIKSYRRRPGLTNFPITWKDLCRNVPVLHAKIKVKRNFIN